MNQRHSQHAIFPGAHRTRAAHRSVSGRASKVLTFVAPRETVTVSLALSRYDFSIWDVDNQNWVIPLGEATISIGARSPGVRLRERR
ncbi:hypothetical protein BD626DRAFT_17892 [Schizophyllum amplum]|uniref:Fibronectin type III-like domain-containing protein n=1 Tax=Schizophyllum amplum TaxID=97359 RepID=A0A550CYC5_9AGAR|nr:hypothetical protein BD626DRAFT_17892 [Auriculariopsis ampla]